jgi:hypothetical protein
MRRSATFIASALVLVLGFGCSDVKPPEKKQSDYKTSPYQANASRAAVTTGGVTFADVTREAGIDFVHVNGAAGKKWLPETMGSGVGLLDYDTDGDLDLLFLQSTPWKSTGEAWPTMRLYRNDGEWKFRDVTSAAGLALPCYGMGLAIADYDADGDPDIYVTTLGHNKLLRNDDGRFKQVEGGPGGGSWEEVIRDDGENVTLTHSSWSTGAAWFDADADGDLDLVVLNYVKWTPQRDVFASIVEGEKAYTRPQLYEGDSARLYLQQDDGSFLDATEGSRLDRARTKNGKGFVPGKSLAVCIDDFNADGKPDVFVANDTVQNFLFLNRGGAKFEEVAVAAGVGYDDNGHARAAMGIDAVDFANDGRLSIAIANFSEEPVSFFTVASAAGEGVLFRDDASRTRVGQPTLLPLTFGLLLRDVDLDGWCDLVLCNGHIEPSISRLKAELQYAQTPQLFRNVEGKRFADVSIDAGAPFQDRFVGRGLAAGDLDGDDDLDLVFTCNNDRPRVLRADRKKKNAALKIRLRQEGSKNLDALGAVVRVTAGGRTQRRVVRSGGSYLSQGDFTVVFGLGEDTGGSVEITWPDGKKQDYKKLAAGSYVLERK